MRKRFSKILNPLPFILLGLSVLSSLFIDTDWYIKNYQCVHDFAGWGILLCLYVLNKIRMCMYNSISLWGMIFLSFLNFASDFYPIKDYYIIVASYFFFLIATLFYFKDYGIRKTK